MDSLAAMWQGVGMQFVRLAGPLVIIAALALGACGATSYVTIRHPLQVGQVDPNSVPVEAGREERRRSLPAGTLVDEAQLLTLTPEQICVRVTIWSTQPEPERSDVNTYSVVLVADNAGVENSPSQVQLEQARTGQFQGTRGEYRGGYSSVQTAFVYQVTHQPATLCFANGGFATPSTTHLTLELRGAQRGTNIDFEWDFASSVAAQSQ